jgi:hypothetical protein
MAGRPPVPSKRMTMLIQEDFFGVPRRTHARAVAHRPSALPPPDAEPPPLPAAVAPAVIGAADSPLVAIRLPAGQTGRLLAGFLPMLCRGRLVYCLDGGNVFDPYRLAELARGQAIEPLGVLERVWVSRAYTCHQLVEAVETMLPPLLEMASELPIAMILGADRLFLDDDLGQGEREHLFRRLVRRATALRRAGLPLLLTIVGPCDSPWGRILAGVARLHTDPQALLERLPVGTPAQAMPLPGPRPLPPKALWRG